MEIYIYIYWIYVKTIRVLINILGEILWGYVNILFLFKALQILRRKKRKMEEVILEWAENLIVFAGQYAVFGEGNGTHSRTLAWKIPWTEEPGRLQSTGSLESDTTEQLPFHFSLSCIGEGNGNPLQCSCLENPRDGEAWWAAVYGVAQSRTRLKRLSSMQWFIWGSGSPIQSEIHQLHCVIYSNNQLFGWRLWEGRKLDSTRMV